jgi:hypothetical protein
VIARLATAFLAVGLLAHEGRGRLDDVAGPWSVLERWAAGRELAREGALQTRVACGEFAAVVEARRGRYALPPPPDLDQLFWHLYLKHPPSESRTRLAVLASPVVSRLAGELDAGGKALRPAALLERCIGAASGDLPLAVLACHDFSKELALRSRTGGIGARERRLAERLAPWRTDPLAPSGAADPIGPVYHLFAAMTAGVWGPSPWTGRLAEYGEAWLRVTRQNLDAPDPEKGEADRCGANVAFLIRRRAAPARRAVNMTPP